MRWKALLIGTSALALAACDNELTLHRPQLDAERGVIEMTTSDRAHCRGATIGLSTRITYDNLPPMRLTGGKHHETPVTHTYPSPQAPITIRFGVECIDKDYELSGPKEAYWYLP